MRDQSTGTKCDGVVLNRFRQAFPSEARGIDAALSPLS
jgi:hypothetical protein